MIENVAYIRVFIFYHCISMWSFSQENNFSLFFFLFLIYISQVIPQWIERQIFFLQFRSILVLYRKSDAGNLEFSSVLYPTFPLLPPFTTIFESGERSIPEKPFQTLCFSRLTLLVTALLLSLVNREHLSALISSWKSQARHWSLKSHCLNQIVLNSNTPFTLTNSVILYMALALC